MLTRDASVRLSKLTGKCRALGLTNAARLCAQLAGGIGELAKNAGADCPAEADLQANELASLIKKVSDVPTEAELFPVKWAREAIGEVVNRLKSLAKLPELATLPAGNIGDPAFDAPYARLVSVNRFADAVTRVAQSVLDALVADTSIDDAIDATECELRFRVVRRRTLEEAIKNIEDNLSSMAQHKIEAEGRLAMHKSELERLDRPDYFSASEAELGRNPHGRDQV